MADTPLVIRVAANLDELKKNMAEGSGVIDVTAAALTRMSLSYDGSKIIQQANATAAAIQTVGGVTNLTAAEQAKANVILQEAIDKYALLGRTAPGGLQALADATKQIPTPTQEATTAFGAMTEVLGTLGIALSVERFVAFAESAVEGAAKLEDLSRATGISADGLQRLAYVASASGIDVDQLTRGVEQLSSKLAGGDKNATTAAELLGLSVKDLIAAGPQEAFLEIADAVGKIDDPMVMNAIATDLWGGRLAKQLIPALHDMRTEMEQVPKDAIITDVNIQKAHDFEVELKQTEIRLESWTATALGAAFTWEHFGVSAKQATDATSDFVGPIQTAAQAAKANDEALIHLTQTVKEKLAADQLAAEATKRFTAAMVEIDSAGTTWQATLDTIDGAVVENMRDLTAAGVSIKSLETYYGLTATQGKAFQDMLKSEQTALKLQAASVLEVTKLWDDYADVVGTDSSSAYDKAGAAIDKWYADTIAKMQKAGTDTAAFYAAISALDDAKWQHLNQNALAAIPYTQEYYQKITDAAQAAYNFALDNSSSFTTTQIQQFAAAYRAAEQNSMHWVAQANADLDSVAAHAKTTTTAVASVGGSLMSTSAVMTTYGAQVGQTKAATDAWNKSIMDTHSMADAVNMDLTSQGKAVLTLAGDYETAEEAKRKFDMGTTVSVTAANLNQMLDTTATSSQFTQAGIISQYGLIGRETQAADLASKGYSFQEIVAFMEGGQLAKVPIGPRIPGFATGVENAVGGWAMVGERGPEPIYVPPGANIYPSGTAIGGASGGGTGAVTIAAGAIVLNFPIMTDPRAKQELAALLGDAIMQRLRGTGVRVPSGA